MPWAIFVKPISQVNARLKPIGYTDFDFVPKGDFIRMLWIGCARPRDPIFQLEASRSRGWCFIDKAEVPRAPERGDVWQDYEDKYNDAQR
jgi:hypothetical protein